MKNAIENVARFLETRRLRNVMVNLYQEFHHPTRIDHELFREPDGAQKKAKLAQWWKAIEVGVVPNHLNGSPVDFPGCDVQMLHEEMPIHERGFVVNTETPDEDLNGHEGVFHPRSKARLEALWAQYVAAAPRAAMLFRSCYAEGVRGRQGTGPNLEMGGDGKGEGDRGMRFFFTWSRQNLGAWQFPKHTK